jgi:hypothetical protein
MDVQTDERLLINIEGYLIELVCNVESIDELDLVAEALVSVQDALRHSAQEPICSRIQEENYSWFVDRVRGRKRDRVWRGD